MRKERAEKIYESLTAFFMGKFYPIVFAALVTVGHVTGLEFYFNFACVAFALLAFCICRSSRPMLITIPAFIFQVSREHSPAWPDYSDYYFTEWRLPIFVALCGIALLAIGFFIARNHLCRGLRIKETALLLPTLILSLAFLMNGAFSATWRPEALAFGAGQLLIYILFFYLIYLGLSSENNIKELIEYFCYITLVISYMILIQMGHLFLVGDVISEEGSIMKENIHFGWATCNPVGSILVSLMPMLFYGAMKAKCGWLYLITALMVYVGIIFTCSRNALLFGTLVLIVSVTVACFKSGKRRPMFIVAMVLGVALVVVSATVMRERLALLFDILIKTGIKDNGRFRLWGRAWSVFVSNGIFGGGFFTIGDNYDDVYNSIPLMPTMAHNTVLELLSSTGIFGLAAYIYYIGKSALLVVNKPSLVKTMLGFAAFTVVASSLLDVFVFCFYPMLYPLAALAIICRITDTECGGGLVCASGTGFAKKP